MEIPILSKRPDFVAMATVYSCEISRYAFRCQNQLLNILNKSENATPELFAIYIQNYANQDCK